MNNRQKAKHFKKLYEELLRKPVPVIIHETILPQHYRVIQAVPNKILDLYGTTRLDCMKESIIRELTAKLKPIVEENVAIQEDQTRGVTEYFLDIYVKRGDKC